MCSADLAFSTSAHSPPTQSSRLAQSLPSKPFCPAYVILREYLQGTRTTTIGGTPFPVWLSCIRIGKPLQLRQSAAVVH